MEKLNFLILFAALLLILGCEKKGLDGKNSLIRFDNEPVSINCTNGGIVVSSGLDINSNNYLDADEVQTTNYICNGAMGIMGSEGLKSLIRLESDSQGDQCDEGGYSISIGIDFNGNDTLDENEIQTTKFICHGITGPEGFNSLVHVEDEPKGTTCNQGGYRINSGIDINRNDTLEESEVQVIRYICNDYSSIQDKQIRIPFVGGGGATTSTVGTVLPYVFLSNFNIGNYPDADSVVLEISLSTDVPGVESIAHLYDKTNAQIIKNTTLRSSSETGEWKSTSLNFIDNLPKHPIELGIHLKSGKNGSQVRCYTPIIYIYRK